MFESQEINFLKQHKNVKIEDGATMLSSKCAVCGSKKSGFVKEQSPKGLLSSLGIKTPLSEVR